MSEVARASRSELGLMVVLGIVVVGAGLLVVLRSSDPPAPPVQVAAAEVAPPEVEPAPVSVQEVVVHVTGSVVAPGVYTLPEGSRVQDAVSAAGGPLDDSDPNALNLAAPVSDGQKVSVPRPGEQVVEEGGPFTPSGGGRGKVNLNTASAAELESLPGIGPVLAERIVAHRQSKGRFSSPRQLMEVSGVGPKKYESLKDLIAT